MPGSATAYLATLATIAMTFVGFSSLVIILRQTLGGEMSPLDVLLTKIFIQLGFIVTAGAMVPALLALFTASDGFVSRLSSALVAVPTLLFAWRYPARRRAASGGATPWAVWMDVGVLIALGAVLSANAAGAALVPRPATFAGCLTGILCVSGWAYLQALDSLLRHHSAHGSHMT
jgi:hypothetical protein